MAQQQTASAAFAEAQRQRQVRAEVLEEVTAGTLTLEQLLERVHTDPLAAKIKLLPVVESLPGMGKVSSRRMLAKLNTPAGCRLDDVAGLPQLADLAAAVQATVAAGQA